MKRGYDVTLNVIDFNYKDNKLADELVQALENKLAAKKEQKNYSGSVVKVNAYASVSDCLIENKRNAHILFMQDPDDHLFKADNQNQAHLLCDKLDNRYVIVRVNDKNLIPNNQLIMSTGDCTLFSDPFIAFNELVTVGSARGAVVGLLYRTYIFKLNSYISNRQDYFAKFSCYAVLANSFLGKNYNRIYEAIG